MSTSSTVRFDVLGEVLAIADGLAGMDTSEKLNLFHSMAKFAGAEGSTRAERLTLAAYAIAINDDDTPVPA